MAGGMHIIDMIKQLRNNEALRKKNYFKKQDVTSKSNEELIDHAPSLSEEERNQLISKIRIRAKEEKVRRIKTLFISLTIVLILAFVFFKFLRF